ncbi:MAG: 16S rRNA (cytidine(1402)-2'-O)-methyltransferase [Methyloligellaceae bacterium]
MPSEQRGSSQAFIESVVTALKDATDEPLAPGLYLVSTPIGNLTDISLRALAVLHGVDIVYCEDTRHSRKILQRYGIRKSLQTYHDHSDEKLRGKIIQQLDKSLSVALISDAGTPLISDPGFKLVREVQNSGYDVTCIPGATSVIAALTISGLPTDRFYFEGFLPTRLSDRQKKLEALVDLRTSLIFFESPSRLVRTLEAIRGVLGDRDCAVVREITKKFEEVLRGSLSELVSGCDERKVKGELVIVVAGAEAKIPDQEDIKKWLRQAMQTQSLRDAAKEISRQHDLPRNKVYELGLQLKQEEEEI